MYVLTEQSVDKYDLKCQRGHSFGQGDTIDSLVSGCVFQGGRSRKNTDVLILMIFFGFSLGYHEHFSQELFYGLIHLKEPKRTLYLVC